MKRATLATVAVLGVLNLALFGAKQTTSAQAQTVSIAILNFQDDSATKLPADLGQKLARDLHQKVALGYKDLLPRLVTGADVTVKGLTLDQVAALAKQSGAKYVVRGGLLALTSEPSSSDNKVTAQLYADVVSADSAAIVTTVRAEGSGMQSGAAPELSALDVNSDQFASSGAGQALAEAMTQLAELVHRTVTGGRGSGLTTNDNTQTTTPNQPDASQTAAQDADLQQLITQAETLLASSSNPSSQSATAGSSALQALKSALEAKATLMQNGKETSSADQDIATQRQALQAAVAQLTADAATASAAGTVATNTPQSTDQKKGFLQTVNDFAGQALSFLQNIQQMRTTLQSLTESSANASTAQTGNSDGTGSTASEQQLGECSGVVTDQNGAAISNAQVGDQTSGASTSTDNNGQYDLKGLLANQTAVLSVTAGSKTITGQTPIVAGQVATMDFQFKPDAVGVIHPIILPPTVVVKSPPGSKVGALKGIVRDPQGRPAARALVMLKGLAIARTDAQGQYQFLNVPAGSQQFSVNQSGLQTKVTQVRVAAAGSTEASVQFGVNERIAPLPRTSLLATTSGGTVAGSVVDSQNHPLAGVKISLVQQTSALGVFSGVSGAFLLAGIKPGQYRVSASKAGYEASPQNVTVSSGGRASLQFRLHPQGSPGVASLLQTRPIPRATIRGRVRSATGHAIANANIALKPIAGNILSSVNTDQNGEYQMSVAPGKYEIRASSNSYQTVSRTLEAPAGFTAQSDFALEPSVTQKNTKTIAGPVPAGNLVGQVTDAHTGHPIGGALVSISDQRQTKTDQTGKFAFDSLPAGRYQITISKPGYSLSQDSISIQPGKLARANLMLQPKLIKATEVRRP